MKAILLSSFFLIIPITCKTQVDDKTTIGNLEINGSIIADNISNISGGIRNGNSFLYLFDLGIDYSFNRGIFQNTNFQIHILKTAGNSPSENLIGDIQVASNIDGRVAHFVYELLIKQLLGNFSLSAGMHDLNSEFMVSDFASDFINSSFGISPAVTLNIPISVFPVTTFGGLASYKIEKFSFKTGFYNLNHDYVNEESFRSENHFYQHGFLSISELSYRLIKDNSKSAEYKIGGYFKQCENNEHADLSKDCTNKFNYGFYFIGDQILKQFDKGQKLGAFVQISFAPKETNFASEYYGAGLSIKNISSKLLPNQIGLAIGAVKLNNFKYNELANSSNFETVVELTAQIPVLKALTIHPDFQYIINPSGIYRNSFTGIVRLMLQLN